VFVNKSNLIIVFDDECVLCNSSVKRIIKSDKNKIFLFTYVKSEYIKANYPTLTEIQQEKNSIILIDDNKFYFKSEAILRISKELKGVYAIFYFFRFIPHVILDFLYSLVSNTRYFIFGKTTSCGMLNQNEQQRILR